LIVAYNGSWFGIVQCAHAWYYIVVLFVIYICLNNDDQKTSSN